MAPDEHGSGRKIVLPVLGGLLAAFLFALVVAPSATAAATGHPASHAAVIHKQSPAVSRADAPDIVIAAAVVIPPLAATATEAATEQTDSFFTVSSTRTRGPPANSLR